MRKRRGEIGRGGRPCQSAHPFRKQTMEGTTQGMRLRESDANLTAYICTSSVPYVKVLMNTQILNRVRCHMRQKKIILSAFLVEARFLLGFFASPACMNGRQKTVSPKKAVCSPLSRGKKCRAGGGGVVNRPRRHWWAMLGSPTPS